MLWSDSDVEIVALDQAYRVNDDNIGYIWETKHDPHHSIKFTLIKFIIVRVRTLI